MEQPIMRKRGVYGVIVAVLVVGVTTLACLLYVDRMQFGNRLQGAYQKQLFDLIGNVQNLETALSKVTVTASPEQAALLFGEIWRQAGGASDRINALPITHVAISETSKFLTQVSDFSFSLLKLQNSGEKLTDEEWKNIEALKKNAAYLGQQLYTVQDDMEEGKANWSHIRYEGARILGQAQTNLIDSKFTDIDKQMQQHPTLIYDGPYSENVLSIEPKVINQPEITAEQAKQKIEEFLGREKIQEISGGSESANGRVPTYPFNVVLKGRDKNNPVDIDISKNGGHVVYMLDSREISEAKIENKKAIDIGLQFLSDRGFKNMIPSFSQKADGILVVNYVHAVESKGGTVVVYPDQIKVKIALDNGDIVGVEAEKYLVAHNERKIPEAKLNVDEARSKASNKIKITNSRLAIIPLLSKREVFCYEFVGKKGDSTFIVYINAENGKEENILQILDTPEGQLAM
ncbi:sporulation protein YpeB [Oxobacter pfennigii]|uniref:Sporulation protein YpeB n=1 Tax=Oxobacter pfennigii TaxID=36849 RepID=A0A0N8NTE2_9CLOT|nr:germination protein YpeB [Oxobacter pfennigii]KPU44584.1 sporulation protein YpeB [Oxobacter pfennigii]